MIITIDGPAGSGKSTVARLLARRLGAKFLDTGAMYRAVTLAAMRTGADLSDPDALLAVMDKTAFKFICEDSLTRVFINGADVTEDIRLPEVTANSRFIASEPALRAKLVQLQRAFAAKQNDIVTEGRDQGTVAFPEANFKFFLTATLAERAARRQAELKIRGLDVKLEEIAQAIEQRDASDQSRAVGPLKKADDAIVIDTTDLSIQQVVDTLTDYINANG